jgi:protein SCO1
MSVMTGVRRRSRIAMVIALGTLLIASCGRDYDQSSSAAAQPPVSIESNDSSPYHGVELTDPPAKPDVTLQDTAGAPFNLATDTAGRVVLVYAGYTHCPDVCPTTVADIAAALRGLPESDRSRVSVVMFTTDPVRDTGDRMRAFLDQFDPSFIGVVGAESAIIPAINSMGIDVQPPQVQSDGDVLVEHGAQVLAFTPPDDRAHLLWTSGTTVDEYRQDIQKLLAAS